MRYKLWDIVNSCWYDHGDIYLDEDGQLFCIEELGGYTPYMNKENVTARYEIVRWTGLTDRNGKEIYEGDVIVGEAGIECVVVWDGQNARFHANATRMTHVGIPADAFIRREVIGSIYTHPELINS